MLQQVAAVTRLVYHKRIYLTTDFAGNILNQDWRKTMKYRIDYSCNGMKIAQYLKGKHGFSSRMLTKLRKTEDGILKNGVPA